MCTVNNCMSSESFYGKKSSAKDISFSVTNDSLVVNKSEKAIDKYPFKYLNPDTPSSVWKVFKKQKDALEDAKRRRNGVMTFVYQSGTGGERLFLVAHPRVFWFYDCRREEQRCSYEIIVEHALCKLYFDLEFCRETNPQHNGVRMTKTFIKIVSFFLKRQWNISCTDEHILDLDSSTDKKFSRHLIYQLPGFVFQDNYHVGNFVKALCHYLKGIKCEDPKSVVEMGICAEEFLELFVFNRGKEQLFCDEGVYSKNRHFRLYSSTKWNRRAPLVRSKENRWLSNRCFNDEIIFLDSLITFIPVDTQFSILDYFDFLPVQMKRGVTNCNKIYYSCDKENGSLFPDVDRFIRHLVAPGRVYRWSYSSSCNSLNYDIVGNRYCHNIGREHRSNNVHFIVDVNKKAFYQKCYDPDCAGFRSEYISLPPELLFILEGPLSFDSSENESLWESNFPEEYLCEILDCIESSIVSEKMFNIIR